MKGPGWSKPFFRLRKRLVKLLVQEEVYWRQRPKSHWLKGGDSNTKYFHASASSRRKNNAIDTLAKEDGTIVDSMDGLCTLANEYFTTLFACQHNEVSQVVDHVYVKLCDYDNAFLLANFIDEEFRRATLDIHLDKAQGPDGLNATFYQYFWDLCGNDVFSLQEKA